MIRSAVCTLAVFLVFPATFLLGLYLSGGVTAALVVAAFVVPVAAPPLLLGALYLATPVIRALSAVLQLGGAAMKARTRTILTVAAVDYLAAVGYLFPAIPLRAFNLLLVTTVVPLVWLIATFARWSANQHAARWARDIENEYGRRPEYRGERVS